MYQPNLIDHEPAKPRTGGLSGATGGSGGSTEIDAATDSGREDAGKVSVGTPDTGPPKTRCGDGLVTDQEKCDIAIESGKPGSCPTDCPPLAACALRGLNGTGCQAECVLLPANCKGGDGCCPAECKREMDSDCSMNCGDGVVQKDFGETCEPGTATPCPTSCDDHVACTKDTLIGSTENCNADCKHEMITGLDNGDGCCPPQANSNIDSDCAPTCGNGVVEKDEQCDGTTGCSKDCKLTLQPEQIRCLDNYAKDDCERCSCMNCVGANQYLACRDADKAANNNKCNAVLMCARANKCTGTPCYCGTADTFQCGLGPSGPCKDPIEAAAGAAPGDWATVTNQRQAAGSTLNIAYTADTCRVSNCSDKCR